MTYYFVDHRAPRYVPRGDSTAVDVLVLITSIFATFAIFGVVMAAVTANGLAIAGAAVAVLVLAVWVRALCRFVICIPDGADSLDAFYVQKHLTPMQRAYYANPGLRDVIGPVLVASYDLGRRHKIEALKDREKAVRELVADHERGDIACNADLDNLRNLLQIRRDMREEGLL